MDKPMARPVVFALASTVLVALGGFALGCSTAEEELGAQEPAATHAGICAATSSWSSQCAAPKDACDDAIASACASVASILNPSVLDAASACLDSQACGSSPTGCLAGAIARAERRPSHVRLAEAFCGCLGPGKDVCMEGLIRGGGPADAALGFVLPLDDGVVDEIKRSCTTVPACATTFAACAESVLARNLADNVSPESATCLTTSVLLEGARAETSPETGGGRPAPRDDDEADDGGARDGESEGAASPAPTCTPKTCEDLGRSCGRYEDGCEGVLDCGVCPTACFPKTCQELGKSCGIHPNGCGGTVSCGACAPACSADAYEWNGSAATAKDIGGTTDSPASSRRVSGLTLPDRDEDWFRTKVTDGGFNGNPRVSVSVGRSLEVSVFYVCDSGGDASYCPNSFDRPDNTVGRGCRGTTSATLKTSCSGLADTGTAYVRVRKLASDGQCVGYTLDVRVDAN